MTIDAPDVENSPASPDATSPTASSSPSATRRFLRQATEWTLIIVGALLLAFLFRTYVAQTFYIPSDSMNPNLLIGDRILVSKISVEWGTVHRGDIVVFDSPNNLVSACGTTPEKYLVKRVIGVPGDHLKSVGDNIYVNGALLSQPWAHIEPLGSRPISPTIVPANHYFMLGDNEPISCDSRYWGTVPRSSIIGKAETIIYPYNRIGFL